MQFACNLFIMCGMSLVWVFLILAYSVWLTCTLILLASNSSEKYLYLLNHMSLTKAERPNYKLRIYDCDSII